MADIEQFNKEEVEQLRFAEQLEKIRQYAKSLDDVLQLSDLTNSTTKSWTVFSKDTLRSYLQNPYSANSQTNLRNLARFLKTLSFPLRRLINYLASLPDFSVYKVIPNISMVEEPDAESILQDYEEVCRYVRAMDLELDLFKMLTIAWGEDVAYFFPVENEDGTTLLYPLDGQYCKLSGVGYNGLYRMAYDFSFFQGSNSFYLDIWPKEFKTKYNAYQRDSSLRWQQLDEGRAFKINIENPDLVVSPLVSLFEQIIDLIDLQSLTAVKDSLEIYKLLVMKIPLLNSKNPDDLALNLNLAKQFYAKALDILPPEIGCILSPGMEVDSVTFDKGSTSESDAISDAYHNLMSNAGVSQIMDSSKLTGQSAVKASMLCDVMLATKGIIPQINAFVNERIKLKFPNTQMIFKYTDVTTYTKEDRIKQLQSACEYSLPLKLELAMLLGQDPLETYAMDWLENQLGLAKTRWVSPLISSHTLSSKSGNGGAPTKDDGDLSDEGAETRDQEKNEQ
jgi:hypothetical protein